MPFSHFETMDVIKARSPCKAVLALVSQANRYAKSVTQHANHLFRR
jgi:hypothetical protein